MLKIALECSNHAHSELDKLMAAFFSSAAGGLASTPPGAARRPHRAQESAGSPAPARTVQVELNRSSEQLSVIQVSPA